MNYNDAQELGRKFLPQYVEEHLSPSTKGNYVCPLCHSGTGPKQSGAFTIMPDKLHFKCFSCHETGSIYDLLMKVENFPNLPSAVHEVARRYGIQIDDDWKLRKEQQNQQDIDDLFDSPFPEVQDSPFPMTSIQPTIKEEPTLKQEVDSSTVIEEAASHIRETDYLLKRGISYETAEKFKIGFVPNWKHPNSENPNVSFTPRIIIPSSEKGYLARLTREAQSYDIPKMKVGSQGIFNEEAIKKKIGPIFVVEGEIDALSIEEIGFPAVALGTTKNHEFIEKARETHPDAFIVALDNDEPGQKASEELIQELKSNGIKAYKANISGAFKDPNEALIKDKEGFIQAVKKAHNILIEEWIEKHSDTKALEEFFKNGLSESAKTRPIPTGFPQLDALLEGGLREGLYGIGAISSLGKTTFVCQIANHAAQNGEDVMIFSLEMSRLELISKSISRHTALIEKNKKFPKIKQNAKTALGITDGHRYEKYSKEELELIKEASEAYRAYSDHILTIEGVGDIGVQKIRELVEQHTKITQKAPIVIIDYLQILAPSDSHFTDKQNTDKAILELKRISRDYKTPVMAISSFNRESYNSKISMSAFKESGAIEYSTDVLLGLQLEGAGSREFDVDAAKEADPRHIELKILKNRRGKTGSSVFFNYYPAFNLFEERALGKDLESLFEK